MFLHKCAWCDNHGFYRRYFFVPQDGTVLHNGYLLCNEHKAKAFTYEDAIERGGYEKENIQV